VKTCSKCGGTGPFNKDKSSKDGLSYYCKKCAVISARKWAESNIKKSVPPDPNKVCTECGGKGPFYRQKGTKDGLNYKCIDCWNNQPSSQPERKRELAVQRRKKNPEKFKVKDAKERKKYAKRRKDNWDSWAYGLKPGEREKLIKAQDGKCAVCQEVLKPNKTTVDHDHKTLRIRGVLCRSCNNLLGSFKDSSQFISNAINYLTSSRIIFPDLPSFPIINDWETKEGKRLYARRYRLSSIYGITLEQFNWLFNKQGSQCTICSKKLIPFGHDCHIDHAHDSKVIRGILCNACNVGLGQGKENLVILKRAVEYLSLHESNKS